MRKYFNRPEVGDIFTTRQGCKIKILEYKEHEDVIIQFQDDMKFTRSTSLANIRKGWVKNPYHPEVRGVGFIGIGPHKGRNMGDRSPCNEYKHWSNMMTRSYCEKYHALFPTYITCSVTEEWHNYQEFAEWCQWQVGFGMDKYVLDKDLLALKGSPKIYSPESCIFLPPEINALIVTQDKKDKKYPAGISFQNGSQKYIVSCAINGKNKNLGRYKCPEEAFSVYKDFKENLVRSKAEEYKDRIDERAYHGLLNFTI